MTDQNATPAPAPAPAAGVVQTAPPPARRMPPPRFDPKKSFEGVNTVDKLKGYLRDVPILHGRLVKVINDWEHQLGQAKADLSEFEAVTKEIQKTVAKWEKEQSDVVGTGSAASGSPAAAPAAATPAAVAAPAAEKPAGT